MCGDDERFSVLSDRWPDDFLLRELLLLLFLRSPSSTLFSAGYFRYFKYLDGLRDLTTLPSPSGPKIRLINAYKCGRFETMTAVLASRMYQ